MSLYAKDALTFTTDWGYGGPFTELKVARDWDNGMYTERTYALSPEESERVDVALDEILQEKQPATEKSGDVQEEIEKSTYVDDVGWFENDQLERLRDVWGIDLFALRRDTRRAALFQLSDEYVAVGRLLGLDVTRAQELAVRFATPDEREEIVRSIDRETAPMFFRQRQMIDPYGDTPQPSSSGNSSPDVRHFYYVDPNGIAVWEGDVPQVSASTLHDEVASRFFAAEPPPFDGSRSEARYFERDAPVLPAYRAPRLEDHVRVWCDWCGVWHHHGAGEGHCVAHCACRRSPYREAGYNLILAYGRAPRRRPRDGCACSDPGGCWNSPGR